MTTTNERRRTGSKSGASSAFGWSLLNTVASRFATLGIGIVLARVLGPDQFGTFAVALVALMAVLSFNELGVSLAIVRWPGDPAQIAPTVNTISLVSSAIVCALAWVGAPTFTALMGNPQATDVVRLLVLSVLINGAVASPAALLQRDFRERTRMGIDQVNVWVGALVSLALALTGMGAIALAVGRLAGSTLSGVLFIKASPLPYRFGWSREHALPLMKFGLPLAGTSIIVFAVGYADQLTAGAILGATVLGFYVLAFNLSSWPVSIVSQPLRRVAPAAFAAVQNDPHRMRQSVLALFGVVGAATVPAFFAIASAAQPLVRLVYGAIWLPAAAALSWLVIAALCRVFSELVYDYIVVLGRTGVVFLIQVCSLVVLIPALALGARLGGLAGIAMAQTAVSALMVLPLYLWQLRRIGVGVGIGAVLGRLRLPFAAGIVSGGFAWVMATSMSNPWISLPAAGTMALGLTAGLLYLRREDLRSLKSIGGLGKIEEPAS